MDPFVGEIRMVGFNYAPNGWALCNGQLLPISQNQALFALLGTTYGGNGTTNFQLPNLQSRLPMHAGQGLGLSLRTLGEAGGVENTSILINNLPAHTHTATFTPSGGGGTPAVNVTVNGSNADGTTNTPGGNYLAGAAQGASQRQGALYVANPSQGSLGAIAGVSATISGVSTGGTVANALTGSNIPLATESPYLVVNFIIALQGVFPPRS